MGVMEIKKLGHCSAILPESAGMLPSSLLNYESVAL